MTMKLRHLAFATAAAVALSTALAQTAAPAPPAAAASVAPKAPPEKRNLTPTEGRDSAPTAGELQPQSRVAPQISIPLNNKAGQVPLKGLVNPAPRAAAKPSGGVDDSTARCSALADPQAREQCRDKLPR